MATKNLSLDEIKDEVSKCMDFFSRNSSDPLQLQSIEKRLNETEVQFQEIYSDLVCHFKQVSNLVALSLRYEDIVNKRDKNFMFESIDNLHEKLNFYKETYGYLKRFSEEMNAAEEKDRYVIEMVEGLHRYVGEKLE